MLGVLLGPETGEEGIAAVGPAGGTEREIDQEGGPFRLGKDRAELLPVRRAQLQRTQSVQADHPLIPQGTTGGPGKPQVSAG
jgi:hypothetical protein